MVTWVKAAEILKKYKITYPTLKDWKDKGWIQSKQLHARACLYDIDSVLTLDERAELYKSIPKPTPKPRIKPEKERINIAYVRVPMNAPKEDLINQLVAIKSHVASKNVTLNKTLIDVGSGTSVDRKEFNNLIKLVCERKVKTVYLLCRDRLVRFSFNIFENIFKDFGTKIELIDTDEFKDETIEQELFKDLKELIEYYCMKVDGDSQTKLNKIIGYLNSSE